ncbi:MAG: tripartite tricarboxylate transporter TctB family protein [Sphaerochaeta sp.]|jgi:hypothetical protein|nr:tripartite tricarboxylate transporter TctB family protein [Sphaerochaeta sp.]
MKIKYNSEMVIGVLLTIASGILFARIPIEIKTLEQTMVNAQTVPRIALGGLSLFSFILFLQGVFLIPKKVIVFDQAFKESRGFKDTIRALIYIGILIIYTMVFRYLGFIVSSIYLIFAILIYYGARKKSYYAIALSVSAGVYLVFTFVLNISLP